MITRREACFVILAIALGSVSAFHCPKNLECIYQSDPIERIKMNNPMNNSTFTITIADLTYETQYILIECFNSPDWSDFRLDVTDLTNNKNITSLHFFKCDLPSNNSLGEIARILGSTDVERLIFQSDKNMNSTVLKHQLDDFKNLKYLSLQNNNSYVDKDLLAGLVKLRILSLKKINLNLVAGFFNYTPGLNHLLLTDNGLRSIELGTFDDLENLMVLRLSRNHLTELQSGIFDELVAVQWLSLVKNDMVKLPEDIFAKLENLKYIYLSENNFTDLPRNLLQNNAKLHEFKLNANKRNMTTLPNEFFANLTELNVLNLAANGFVTLPEDLFWGCTSLNVITLDHNYLQTLPVDIFRDLDDLKELYLNSNDFATLPDGIFKKKPKLVKLDLSKNRITFFSEELFSNLRVLEELNMEDNRLMFISCCSFRFTYSLKIAKFSKNNLTFEYSGDKCKCTISNYKNRTPFYFCKSLEKLYLANNNISQIFIDWRLDLPQLRELDLKYNNIPYISTKNVQFVSKNIQVDLTNNKIKHILLHNIERTDYLNSTNKYMKILVSNNPLHCDCRLYNFLRYIEGRMQPRFQNYFHIIQENLTCQTPKELKNVRVTDLRSKSLTCVSNYTACPKMCNCLERSEDNAFIFDCSQRNLTNVPNIKKANDSLKFELNFSGNRLTRMPDLKAMELESVKNLILSHNNIIEISLDGLSSTIQILELHNNNVSRIHPDVIEFLKHSMNLTRLTLHENPWKCDCDAKEFQNFIRNQTKIVTIPDLINVKCVGSNISVSETTDFCVVNTANDDQVNTAMIIGVSITISLIGFLIGFIGLLYYKYQRQIQVWLFAHQWCLWFVTEEELDKGKLYDAFVSYSHKDHEFVENELVSKLENGSTPFKLCLHYRDWLAGEWIPANIASSVENSRRTIVVLSPNFLESVWGRMEFRAAHSQALSEGRARVILILYGDIGPIDNLDPELKAYISMNTYVKWGDPWFWDRLKYALPHQPKLAGQSIAGNKIFENHQMCTQVRGDEKELVYQSPLARCSEPEIEQGT